MDVRASPDRLRWSTVAALTDADPPDTLGTGVLTATRARPVGSRLAGFGAALPGHTLSAADLGASFGRSGDWVETRTGISRLGRVRSGAELRELIRRAARTAIDTSQVRASDVDLVITTGCSTVRGPHDVGRVVADVAARAPELHLNAACSGFCYALSSADSFIRAGTARTVLVVGAEQMSSVVDPEDLGTSIVFGDGAGAAVVAADESGRSGVGPVAWGSDGAQAGVLHCRADGLLSMAGSHVFRWAVEMLPRLARQACERAGVTLADIEVFVPHQANLRIVDAVVQRLELRHAVIADSVRSAGNTSAASIPIALADLAARGLLGHGQLALLAGFGAGLSWAAQVVRLP